MCEKKENPDESKWISKETTGEIYPSQFQSEETRLEAKQLERDARIKAAQTPIKK